MKTNKISYKIIMFAVQQYEQSGTSDIADDLFNLFPNESNEKIESAVKMLEHDGLIDVEWADDTVYELSINPEAIRNTDNNSLLKKGYRFLKEIKDWL